MDVFEVRTATAADARSVADYHQRCLTTTYCPQLLTGEVEAPDVLGTRQQLHDWFLPESGFETLIAVIDDAPIGHVTVSGHQLVHLFVEPDHQNMGLGSHLLALGEAMLAARGHTSYELHARVENLAAIAFYEKAGWTVTDRLVHTVEHGIGYDERVLVKQRTSRSGISEPAHGLPTERRRARRAYRGVVEWDERLHEMGQRSTPARRAVLDVIGSTSDHLSADEIAIAVADRAADVHRATVFRTLDRLVTLGLVAHVHLPHGATTYHLREPAERMHLHLLCRGCHQVFDTDAGLLDDVAERLADTGFELDPAHSALSGWCGACRTERG